MNYSRTYSHPITGGTGRHVVMPFFCGRAHRGASRGSRALQLDRLVSFNFRALQEDQIKVPVARLLIEAKGMYMIDKIAERSG
jgi:hypothetical protein